MAAYQTALRAVTYRNTSSNPSTAPRTLTFLASDGAATSAPATRAINVSPTDNAPDVDNSAGALAYTENDPATAIDTTITITDVDSANLDRRDGAAHRRPCRGRGRAALPAQPVVTAAFDAPTGTLTLSGTATVAAYETALEAVTYRNTSDNPSTATRTVTYTARDAGGFGAPTRTASRSRPSTTRRWRSTTARRWPRTRARPRSTCWPTTPTSTPARSRSRR